MSAVLDIREDAFEYLLGTTSIGSRRLLDSAAVGELEGFADRYATLLRLPVDGAAAGLLTLGRDLYRWLDGDAGQLSALRKRAGAPFLFEVQAPASPSGAEWALVRVPFELLADEQGFLAQDALERFSPVRRLGRPAEPPDLGSHRLGLTFMASSPRGAHELAYEAEETAILTSVGEHDVDLVVEESGDPEELGRRLGDVEAMHALHLSCHGHNAWRPPAQPDAAPTAVLLMEDEAGNSRPTTAADLIPHLDAQRPRFLFLSACLSSAVSKDRGGRAPARDEKSADESAASERVAHSFATALVTGGIPAVLGWDGSVADVAATAFAGQLYERLSKRVALSVAVADARRVLVTAQEEGLRRDWHLARLWLGPMGGGPLVGGSRRRSLLPATRAKKVFLAKAMGAVPVAPHKMFVGRRRQLQETLRILRGSERAGVLLHGMGRLGKSSLAARVVDRLSRRAAAVVFGRYGALDVVEALEAALRTHPAARDLLAARKDDVRQDPTRLEALLIDLLHGPCRQHDEHGPSLLLVIDDLEQILEPVKDRPHRVRTAEAPVLASVLRAFTSHDTDSRLLLTSRYTFSLEGLEGQLHPVPLPAFSEAAQKKLEILQERAARDAGMTAAQLAARAKLLPRVLRVARGNPGLQDLIGQRIVLASTVPLARATQALTEMEGWLGGGDLPDEPEVREFLEGLAVETLLDLAGPTGKELLRALTVFGLPIPEAIAQLMADQVGGSLTHLRDLGLLDVGEGVFDHRVEAVAVNALAAARLPEVAEQEVAALATICLRELFEAWGGDEDRLRRPYRADLELVRLGLAAEDAHVVAATAADAVRALDGLASTRAAAIGRAAIDLLDRCGVEPSLRLLSTVARVIATAGDGASADALFTRGKIALDAEIEADETPAADEVGSFALECGRRLVMRGDLARARRMFEIAARSAAEAEDERGVMIVRGEIASILAQEGDVEEVLRICREEQLPVFERLGDVRAVAIVKGRIADVLAEQGDVEEALRIRREEELPVYERLRGVREVAVVKGKIADVLAAQGEVEEALRIWREDVLPALKDLGDVRTVAIIQGRIADVLAAQGDVEEALRIRREEQLLVYERLGDVRAVAVVKGRIAGVLAARGDVEEALRIRREEQLPVFERLGDVREVAVTKGQIADVLLAQGDVEEALRIWREDMLPALEDLGDVRTVAVVKGRIADVLVAQGDVEAALRIWREEQLPVFERLGDVREMAVAEGRIADALAAQGDVEEALRIRREEQLPVYERLGDVKSIAVTKGKIADVLAAQGDVEEALRIRREEQLPVFERLGDVREVAVTKGQIAHVLLAQGDVEEALRIWREDVLPLLERLGEVGSVAITKGRIADVLAAQGEVEEALRVRREEELPVYERLGDLRAVAITKGQIADALAAQGEVEEALRIWSEDVLPVLEGLGAARDVAAMRDRIAGTLWRLAQADLERKDFEAAAPRVLEAYRIVQEIGRTDGIALIGTALGQLLVMDGHREEGLGVLRASRDAYEELGGESQATQLDALIAQIQQDAGESVPSGDDETVGEGASLPPGESSGHVESAPFTDTDDGNDEEVSRGEGSEKSLRDTDRESKLQDDLASATRALRTPDLPAVSPETAGASGTRPPAGSVPEDRHTTVPVYFGTSRNVTSATGAIGRFGGDRGDLSLGRAEVSIPDLHVRGELERPKWWKLQFREDPDKHVVLRSVEVLDPRDFTSRAREDLVGAASEALLFIHGYNVSFDDALTRTAQITYDLQFGGLAALYSWPSAGSVAKYAVDETNVAWSRPDFEAFLRLLLTELGVDTVHVLAHSMGNRVLAETLANLDTAALPTGAADLREIFFAAPDIDAETFADLAEKFRPCAGRFTLYASCNDKALKASKVVHGYQRAGDTEPQVGFIDAVDTIDASSVDTGLVELNHSYFSEKRTILSDIFNAIRHGLPPAERYGLIERPIDPDGRYWEFRP